MAAIRQQACADPVSVCHPPTNTTRCLAEPYQPDMTEALAFQWLAWLLLWFSQINSLPTDSGPNSISLQPHPTGARGGKSRLRRPHLYRKSALFACEMAFCAAGKAVRPSRRRARGRSSPVSRTAARVQVGSDRPVGPGRSSSLAYIAGFHRLGSTQSGRRKPHPPQ
jgi:hypothetical protein